MQLFRALKEEIPTLVAVSLRDRDEEPVGTVGDDLADKGIEPPTDFTALKWRRRHLETYLVHPDAIATVSGLSEDEVAKQLSDRFGVAITAENFVRADAPEALLDLRGKAVISEGADAILGQFSAGAYDLAKALTADQIPADVRTVLERLQALT